MGPDDERYAHIAELLRRFQYARLGRADKGGVLRYVERTTGYSRQQLTRLVRCFLATRQLKKRFRPPKVGASLAGHRRRRGTPGRPMPCTAVLSRPSTCVLQAFAVYGDARYERLALISVGHLYNLRQRAGYVNRRQHWTKTKGTQIPIGERRAPSPDGLLASSASTACIRVIGMA